MRARVAWAVGVSLLIVSGSGWAQVAGLGSASLPARHEASRAPDPAQVHSLPRDDQFGADRDTYAPGRLPLPGTGVWSSPIYGYGYGYGYGHGYGHGHGHGYRKFGPSRRSMHQTENRSANGYLDLEVQPTNAHVYVDGAYVGNVADIRRLIPGRSLEPGLHRVELREAGYDDLSFDVSIVPHETITYRRNMERKSSATAAVSGPEGLLHRSSSTPKTFYVIPGCYAGDRHPRMVQLLPGCDASKVRTIPAVLSLASRAK